MQLDPIKVNDTRNWFLKSQDDIAAAELLVGSSAQADNVAFHCQQAVEKCLKGYRFWHDRQFKKTHDLNILSQDCIQIDSTLQPILVEIAPLTQFAVDYRYPDYPGPLVHPTEIEANEYIQVAKNTYQALAERLPFAITSSEQP